MKKGNHILKFDGVDRYIVAFDFADRLSPRVDRTEKHRSVIRQRCAPPRPERLDGPPLLSETRERGVCGSTTSGQCSCACPGFRRCDGDPEHSRPAADIPTLDDLVLIDVAQPAPPSLRSFGRPCAC